METIPLVMRTIGTLMQQRHAAELSFSQFRAMMIVHEHAGASLSLLADLLGLTLSATSKLIDGLVERGFVSRDVPSEDRRRVTLTLTSAGDTLLKSLREEEAHLLGERLINLTDEECRLIAESMSLLSLLFSGHGPSPQPHCRNGETS